MDGKPFEETIIGGEIVQNVYVKSKRFEMYHMLFSRKGINLHLQEMKMDLSRGNEKAIGVFALAVKPNSWAEFQRKSLVKWREWAKCKT